MKRVQDKKVTIGSRPPHSPPWQGGAGGGGNFFVLHPMKRFIFHALLVCNMCFLPVMAQQSDDKLATFFVGRVKYSKNDGNDCSGVGKDLIQLVSRTSTIQVQEERKVRLADENLYETPFLFMNGHNDFVLSDVELENLRKYLSHGGFIFASGCCTNPGFPIAWRREFSRIFPGETVKRLSYDHLIYRSFYKLEKIRTIQEQKEVYLEGLSFQGSLVGVMCEEGLCCSFAMANNCNDGRGIEPNEGKKIALNIAVYSLTH